MVRKEIVIAGLLTSAGLAGGYWLLPEESDIARMEVRDYNYDDPAKHYETLFEKGDRSVDVVQQLVRIHTNTGNVDRAIEVLRAYVETHPEDNEALHQLGMLYQSAQRYPEYMAILEARAKEKEDPAVLLEMAQLYNFFQQTEKQKETLQRLYELEKGSNSQTIRDLTIFRSADKEFAQVAQLMETLLAQHAGVYNPDDAIMHTNALLELGRQDEAAKIVGQWRDMQRGTDADLATLIDMLHYQGSPRHARMILDSLPEDRVQASPDLLHSQLLVMMAEGKRDEAYKLLTGLYEQNKLPDMLVPDLMYMAAVNGNTERFHELREKAGLSRLPEKQLADIWLAARYSGQRDVVRAISQHVGESGTEGYPLLQAMILVAERSPARHAAVRSLLEGSLDNESLLKLAAITAENGDRDLSQKALAKLPDYDNLTRTELAELENIYLKLNDIEKAKSYIAYLRQSGRLENDHEVGLRTAAAIGEGNTLRDWQKQHGSSASPELLTDLFYHASNKGHLTLALEIAQWQNDPRQKAEARRGIADIYTRMGRYEAALNLLEQDAPRTEAEARDRVFLISKLAPRNAAYQQKLHSVARQWFKPSTSRKTKEDITFAVMNVGGNNAALPYMKALADQYGGEWTLTYAYALMDAKRSEEAAPYFLKAAKDPSLDADTRLNIAYALSDRGHRAEAEQLLMTLAEEPATRQKASEQLAYLWGPRPDEQKLAWLIDSWRKAEGESKQTYGKLLAGKMTPDVLDTTVRANPDLRYVPEMDSDYLALLAEQGRLRSDIEATAEYARESGDTSYLLRLADLARDNGSYADARLAYDHVLAVEPQNQSALVGATVTASAQSDYTAINRYFTAYEQAGGNATVRDQHKAYFAYAENLRRENKLKEAQPYYSQTVQLIEGQRFYDTDSLSIAAQSNAWMADGEKSERVFNYAFSRYPHDAIIRADRAALLLEQRRYDEAQTALNAVELQSSDAPKSLETAFLTPADTGTMQAPRLLDDGRQLLVPTTAETTEPRYWIGGVREHPSVSYVSEGYDSVLVVTKVGHRFTVNQNGDKWTVDTIADAASAPRSEQAQLELRKELMTARLELETGKLESASERMDSLESTYSEDPQYLGFAANTAYYSNMWPTAKRLISEAATRSPDNADIARLKRSIEREHADHVRADVTLTNRSNNRDITSAVSGETQVPKSNWRVGGVFRHHDLKTKGELQPSGVIGGRKGTRQTGHIYGIYSKNGNDMWTAHLFANNDTPGAGVDYSFVNRAGVTTLAGRYHEPYFEFVEGMMDDAVRDRVAVSHVYKPRTDWELSGGVSYNNYSLDVADDVMSTAGVELGVVHAIQQSGPYIGVGYGLNAEYEIENDFQTTQNGLEYRRLPLRTREIHFGSATVAHDFSDMTYGSVMVGYGWDRFGGNGPAVEGTINHEVVKDWDVGARAFYGMSTNSSQTDDDLTQVNGYVRRRF